MRADKREAYEARVKEERGDDAGGLPFGLTLPKLPELPKDFDWDQELPLPKLGIMDALMDALPGDDKKKK